MASAMAAAELTLGQPIQQGSVLAQCDLWLADHSEVAPSDARLPSTLIASCRATSQSISPGVSQTLSPPL